MLFWDKNGLLINGLIGQLVSLTAQATAKHGQKSYDKVKRRFDQIISTGLIGWSEIVNDRDFDGRTPVGRFTSHLQKIPGQHHPPIRITLFSTQIERGSTTNAEHFIFRGQPKQNFESNQKSHRALLETEAPESRRTHDRQHRKRKKETRFAINPMSQESTIGHLTSMESLHQKPPDSHPNR